MSSADSTVTGLGSIEFTAGTEASFFVQARDAYSNPLDEEACYLVLVVLFCCTNMLCETNIT